MVVLPINPNESSIQAQNPVTCKIHNEQLGNKTDGTKPSSTH